MNKIVYVYNSRPSDIIEYTINHSYEYRGDFSPNSMMQYYESIDDILNDDSNHFVNEIKSGTLKIFKAIVNDSRYVKSGRNYHSAFISVIELINPMNYNKYLTQYKFDDKLNCVYMNLDYNYEVWKKFDEFGNEIEYRNSRGYISDKTIKTNANGKIIYLKDNINNDEVILNYDDYGNEIYKKVIRNNVTSIESICEYDSKNNCIKSIHNGEITKYYYNKNNHLIKTIPKSSLLISNSISKYDTQGRLIYYKCNDKDDKRTIKIIYENESIQFKSKSLNYVIRIYKNENILWLNKVINDLNI